MEKMGISFENSKTETVQNDKSIYSFCIAVIGATIISPIYEEILYRGVFIHFFVIDMACGAVCLLVP